MKISMNLILLTLTHCFSYKIMNWSNFRINIPVIVNMWFNIYSYINLNSKINKDLVRINWYPRPLFKRAVKTTI